MSNPGVITLAQLTLSSSGIKRFQIEDNIGEAIHIHIDNWRLDLTINEFLDFVELIKSSLNSLDVLKGYSITDFEPDFLLKCAPFLSSLESVSIEKIALRDLRVIVYQRMSGLGVLSRSCRVADAPAYQYLAHQDPSFLNYEQDHYIRQDNKTRLFEIKQSIEKFGYPSGNRYIVLFNNQNYVRDGQHRAAILASLRGLDAKIEVMRWRFRSNTGNLCLPLSNAIAIAQCSKRVARNIYRRLRLLLCRDR